MRHFHIGGKTKHSTADGMTELDEQSLENRYRSLCMQVEQLFEMLTSLQGSAQVGSEAFEAYQRVKIIAAGLGLTDAPSTLFERAED